MWQARETAGSDCRNMYGSRRGEFRSEFRIYTSLKVYRLSWPQDRSRETFPPRGSRVRWRLNSTGEETLRPMSGQRKRRKPSRLLSPFAGGTRAREGRVTGRQMARAPSPRGFQIWPLISRIFFLASTESQPNFQHIPPGHKSKYVKTHRIHVYSFCPFFVFSRFCTSSFLFSFFDGSCDRIIDVSSVCGSCIFTWITRHCWITCRTHIHKMLYILIVRLLGH